MLVSELIQTAFANAKKLAPETASSEGELHRQRSIAWVNALSQEFGDIYPVPEYRVFSKYEPSNRVDFGLNELLFDIAVCEVGETPSSRNQVNLHYVKRAIWQVESEFAPNTRAAIADFNKLVLGSSDNKLFVGPVTGDAEAFATALLPVARCCTGRVILALVPHPKDWQQRLEPILLASSSSGWRSGDGESA